MNQVPMNPAPMASQRHATNQGWAAPQVQYVAAPAHGTNGFAIASLIFGLLGGGLLAVVFGHIAHSQIKRTPQAGKGLATAGLILGYIGLAVSIILIIALASIASSPGY